MTSRNVDLVRRGIEAFNRRDFEEASSALHDDVRWERFLSRAEADSPFVRGKDELLAVWESQVEAVDVRLEPEEFIAAGHDKVVVPSRMAVRGSGSDIVLSAPVTWVYTLDEASLVIKVDAFDDLAAALEAVGLQPQLQPGPVSGQLWSGSEVQWRITLYDEETRRQLVALDCPEPVNVPVAYSQGRPGGKLTDTTQGAR